MKRKTTTTRRTTTSPSLVHVRGDNHSRRKRRKLTCACYGLLLVATAVYVAVVLLVLYQFRPRRTKFSSLRLDWSNLPPLSPLARRIQEVQTQCLRKRPPETPKQPVVNFHLLPSGMGSSLHTWSQLLCHATERGALLWTTQLWWNDTGRVDTWEWNDRQVCDPSIHRQAYTVLSADRRNLTDPPLPPLLQQRQKRLRRTISSHFGSPLWCYFGAHESGLHCPPDTLNFTHVPRPSVQWQSFTCPQTERQYTESQIRAAAMEWLFQNVTSVVLQQVERQVREDAFPEYRAPWFSSKTIPPSESLITVHIRWGDKKREMELVPIAEYINATLSLLTPAELAERDPVHIYITSEDPQALPLFVQHAPTSHWQIHSSGPTNALGMSMLTNARHSKGQQGLQSLAALLIALEANRFVLTTASNWSRLLNELRQAVVDPRCGYCTQIVDLRYSPE